MSAKGTTMSPMTRPMLSRTAVLIFSALLTAQVVAAQTAETMQASATPPEKVDLEVVRLDPGLDKLLPPDAAAYEVADNFRFIEGPIWIPAGKYLRFSDTQGNRMYQYTPASQDLKVFRQNSGYSGADVAELYEPGSNGLTLDPQGRLTMCQHGNRRVARLNPDGSETALADHFEGKRLNSPNDLVFRSDGTLYFTDPNYGLRRLKGEPQKELDFQGVYSLRQGKLTLVDRDLATPNGIALSPDEKYLYVGDGKHLMRYQVHPDGTAGDGTLFFDMSSTATRGGIDGMKVDVEGNLYVTGPGGLWIISSEGKHLGTLTLPQQPANVGWGEADARTLYLTARTGLYRIRFNVPGSGRFKK